MPSTEFPLRWLYPSNELSYNTENLNTALARQYGGNDNVNGEMWILKNYTVSIEVVRYLQGTPPVYAIAKPLNRFQIGITRFN